MKIYTKTGDDGTTSLFAGGRVPKTHLRVECYGTVDELNSVIGVARSMNPSGLADEWLTHLQHDLFNLGADLATPRDAKAEWVVRIDATHIAWLEETIDRMDTDLPTLKAFILPGGTPAAAHIHVARTVCRRAERRAILLAEQEHIGEHIIPYLNRLSDFLFTLARWENLEGGETEEKWALRDT
ncbi:MAG: cob(I)yrinic acid a,c-diamide adenosyltransferase [Chloroflexi bacterium]|nr:MAG: cob(I)yrinic acid a,c-diamide adenosyltransferase [Chloroflexota bacterium]